MRFFFRAGRLVVQKKFSTTTVSRKIVPLLDRVLVEKSSPKTKTVGGILLPESAQTKLNEGMVISVGPGTRNKDGTFTPTSVKPGDRVLLPEYGGAKVKLEDNTNTVEKEYFLFRDDDILAKVDDSGAQNKKK